MVWRPGRKGTRARVVYRWKCAVFPPNFARITARYCPKPFTSGAIENKVKKGALRFCARSNLRLLSFNDPEYRPLQACLNVEMPSSLIFEPLAPARWGVTGHWTVNISRISMDICVVPTNARANRVLARSFSPRILNLRIFRKTNVFLPDYTRMVITSLVIIIFSWIGFSTHKAINPCHKWSIFPYQVT